jgi:hypothetical protein
MNVDDTPLTYTLVKQLLDKGETVYAQRQFNASRQGDKSPNNALVPALFPIQKIEHDNDGVHITVVIVYAEDDNIGQRPHRTSFHADTLDELFTLDRSAKGKWVLRRKNVIITDRMHYDVAT